LQIQENDGIYRKPEKLNAHKVEEALDDRNVRKILIFPAYGEDGKPSTEMRRAWRRYSRTRRAR